MREHNAKLVRRQLEASLRNMPFRRVTHDVEHIERHTSADVAYLFRNPDYFYCVINAIGLQIDAGRRLTAWTSREGFCERDGEAFSDRRDPVFDVAFGERHRRRLRVDNRRVGEASCAAGRLRGESRPVPRSRDP